MKKIQPVTIWKNGESQEANLLLANSEYDNLESACSFIYKLCSSGEGTEAMPLVIGQTLAQGNITMKDEDYLAWDNSNEAAYVYIAEKLNLTLIA
jgi:transcriptional antiterminator Rof (Rho-off)